MRPNLLVTVLVAFWLLVTALVITASLHAGADAAGEAVATPDASSVEQLVLQLESKQPNERIAAAQQLCLLREDAKSAFPKLIELLADDAQAQLNGSSLSLRYHMRNLFIKMGPVTTDSLIAALSHKNRLVRMGAAEVLGELRAELAVDALIERLGDADRAVASEASTALVKIGEPSIDPLLKKLGGDNGVARQFAAGALGSIRHERVVRPVAKVLFDPDDKMQEWAVESLRRLAFANSSGFGWPPAVDPSDRKAAGARAATDAILRKLVCDELNIALKSENQAARMAAARCCQFVSSVDNRDALAECMADTDAVLRRQAVQAIMVINDPSILKLLLQALGDSSNEVRAEAANGLRYRGGSFTSGEELIEPLVKALGDSDHRVRQNAAEALAALQTPKKREAVPEVIKLLQDTDEEVVKAAIRSLVALGDKQGVEPIYSLLSQPAFKTEATLALAELRDPRVIEPLRALSDKKDTKVIRALGTLKDRESVYRLIMFLEDRDQSVRDAAAEALGEIGDIRAVEPLVEALEKDPHNIGTLARALSKIKHPYAVLPLIHAVRRFDFVNNRGRIFGQGFVDNDAAHNPITHSLRDMGTMVIEPLSEALTDPSNSVRGVAAYVLCGFATQHNWNDGNIDREEIEIAIEPLVKALSDSSTTVRYQAAMALGALKEPRAVDVLLEVVAACEEYPSSASIYQNAANHLSSIRDPRSVEPLIKLLEHEKPMVRMTAVNALGWMDDQRAVEPLVLRLKDADLSVRARAAVALSQLKAHAALGEVQKLLVDDAPSVRAAAAEALGYFRDPQSADALVNLTGDQHFQVRTAAAIALLRLKDDRGLESISQCFKDSKTENRAHVATQLCGSGLKNKGLVEALKAALDDPSIQVRLYSADALGEIGTQAAADALLAKINDRENLRSVLGGLIRSKDVRAFDVVVQHLDDPEMEIRRTAVYGVGELNHPTSIEVLTKHLADPSPEVRIAVLNALTKLKAKSALASIKHALEDESPEVRARAARALRKLE